MDYSLNDLPSVSCQKLVDMRCLTIESHQRPAILRMGQ